MTRMNKYAGMLILVTVVSVMAWFALQYWQVAPSLLPIDGVLVICMVLGLVLLVTSLVLLVRAIVAIFYRPWREGAGVGAGLGVAGLGLAGALGAVVVAGAAWGRPLRVGGRQVHTQLREGADWARGPTPSVDGLDAPTRQALEALWLHDAQKEHASVPAFSRIVWLLAAVGAPADLMDWAHRAALQEVDHARLCFALAAGYGGRTHTVQPMPELLGALSVQTDAISILARESILDGCQLEDFNADVAHACAQQCQEPAARQVLAQIAREERSHAEFSWALLSWLLAQHSTVVRAVVQVAQIELASLARPTAVVHSSLGLVEAADAGQLLRHGRIPDERWAQLWSQRLAKTRLRLQNMLDAAAQSDGVQVAQGCKTQQTDVQSI